MALKGKRIVLGVSGSIAAYKAASLIRLLVKEEAEVKVVMTQASTSFITPLTLSTLSKNPVVLNWEKDNVWNNHVDLGLWADLLVIAPASANTLAKLANGFCDNQLIATYLSARCKTVICPAMDEDMFKHPSTTKNISSLIEYGDFVMDVGEGELASGLIGPGRMPEPEEIVEEIKKRI